MIEAPPAPLVSADVDLRGYGFMPLYGDRLFKSETWISASNDAKVAALRLWWHSWAHEVPASSLPNSDKLLAEYAGVPLRLWGKLKPQVMHNFVECSDGRLYHAHLAEWAREAWKKRVRERERKARFLASKNAERNVPGTYQGTFQERGENGSGTDDRERERERDSDRERKPKTAIVETPDISARGNGSETGKIAQNAIENTGKIANGTGQKWDDRPWVAATARTLGVQQRQGEDWAAYRDRVFAGVQQQIAKAKAAAGHHA